ncbi:MAG TPA: hemerythrin domain-containing protein [Micromonosporaceae bacterium]|nr:hemerythrin domain-containing protein [Micromonosporaceae bacterium]
MPQRTEELIEQFATEHDQVRRVLAQLRTTADLVAADPGSPECVSAVRDIHTQFVDQVLPHEQAEEQRLYPSLAEALGTAEATAPMSRTHVEIHRLVDRIDGHLHRVSDSRFPTDLVPDLLATLYGLDAVLRLHLVQEEEDFFSLASAERSAAS